MILVCSPWVIRGRFSTQTTWWIACTGKHKTLHHCDVATTFLSSRPCSSDAFKTHLTHETTSRAADIRSAKAAAPCFRHGWLLPPSQKIPRICQSGSRGRRDKSPNATAWVDLPGSSQRQKSHRAPTLTTFIPKVRSETGPHCW